MLSNQRTPIARSEFLAGCRDIAPVLVGTVPFGVVAGVAGVGVLLGENISIMVFLGLACVVLGLWIAHWEGRTAHTP